MGSVACPRRPLHILRPGCQRLYYVTYHPCEGWLCVIKGALQVLLSGSVESAWEDPLVAATSGGASRGDV